MPGPLSSSHAHTEVRAPGYRRLKLVTVILQSASAVIASIQSDPDGYFKPGVNISTSSTGVNLTLGRFKHLLAAHATRGTGQSANSITATPETGAINVTFPSGAGSVVTRMWFWIDTGDAT